jgi:hypothetical protein
MPPRFTAPAAEGKEHGTPEDAPILPVPDQATGLKLAKACYEAEARVCVAEASVAVTTAQVALVGKQIADLRALAAGAGIELATPAAPSAGDITPFMSIDEFATLMRVSPRKMASELKLMLEGTHYHRAGRRVIIRVSDAAEFIRSRKPMRSGHTNNDALAIDEVTRRRAKTALNRARAKEKQP